VTLQSRQAVRTEELPIQDSNYLGLEAIVPDASLAARALPVPDGLLGPASPLDRGHPAAAVAEDHPSEGPGGPARLRSATPVGLGSAPHALRSLPEFDRDDRRVSRRLGPHPLRLGIHPVAAGLPLPPVPDLEAGVLGVVEDPRDRSAAPRPASGRGDPVALEVAGDAADAPLAEDNSRKMRSTTGACCGSGSRTTLCFPRSAIDLAGWGRKRFRYPYGAIPPVLNPCRVFSSIPRRDSSTSSRTYHSPTACLIRRVRTEVGRPGSPASSET